MQNRLSPVRPFRAPLIVLLPCLALIGGCSDGKRGAVSGRVTLDGQPIEEGRITFIPAEGNSGPTAGSVILNGNYRVPASGGAWVGKNRVEIRGVRKSGNQTATASAYPRGTGGTEKVEERAEAVPEIYNTRSQLVEDIRAGSNQIDFELRSK
jgi:hypothetical protein